MRIDQVLFSSIALTLIVAFNIDNAKTEYLNRNCDDVKTYAEEAYSYLRKSYNSRSLDDAKYYAKKGMNAASSAEDEADDSDCGCDDAESIASDTYSYAKKILYVENISDAQYYAKKAMNSASEILNEADDCENE